MTRRTHSGLGHDGRALAHWGAVSASTSTDTVNATSRPSRNTVVVEDQGEQSNLPRSIYDLRPRLASPTNLDHDKISTVDTATAHTEHLLHILKRFNPRSFPTPSVSRLVALGSEKHEAKLTVISASLLIPGDGDPIPDAALVISDDVIAWVGPSKSLPSKYDADKIPKARRLVVPYLMPGLWDCHVHFGGQSDSDGPGYLAFLQGHPAACGSRLARGCWETIQAGYTSVRDVAGYGCEIAKAVEDGTIIGPNIYSSGACLSQLGGHGDIFYIPAGDVLLNLSAGNVVPGHFGSGMTILADGQDQARTAVRLQIRRGAKLIKVLASGGVMSRDDDPNRAQFSPEELQVIVEEAERQGRIVAAHVHGKPGIMNAINAGCKTLEHVSYGDEEVVKLVKEKNILWVATRSIIDLIANSDGTGIEPESWRKMKALASAHRHAYELAIKSGVDIALGTDADPGAPFAIEIEAAVKYGMTNLQALRAATAMGPRSVGALARKSGQLKEGFDADMLALKKNPVADVRVLQDWGCITHVWKGGRLLKGPGIGPWGEGGEWNPSE